MFPTHRTPHKYTACRCRSELVSDLSVAQLAQARTRLRYGVSCPQPKSRICARQISQGDPLTATIDANVSPLTLPGQKLCPLLRAGTESRMPLRPGSVSAARPAHPRRRV
jgi:hypothetical protein